MYDKENAELLICEPLHNETPVVLEHSGIYKIPSIRYYNCFVIAYVAHGSGFLQLSLMNSIEINEGDIILMKPELVHSMHYSIDLMELYYCKFLSGTVAEAMEDIVSLFPKSKVFSEDKDYIILHDYTDLKIRNIMISMIEEYMSNNTASAEILSSYLKILLYNIFRINEDKKLLHTSDNKWVGATIQYIYSHLYSGVNLKELAKIHNITPEHLCRTFKKHMGMTIWQFINDARIKKIKDMLANTDRSIRSINELFNINNQHLQKCFKKSVGITMTEYRAKYRSSKQL